MTAGIPPGGVATDIVSLFGRVTSATPPLRIRAWDGSEAGPAGAPVVVLRSRNALRRIVWNRGELGLARAFVSGDLAVEGDLVDALRRCRRIIDDGGRRRFPWPDVPTMVRLALRWRLFGPRPSPPATEVRLAGRRHTRGRDRAAIAYHYDLGNAFYQFLLDERMVYSCGYRRRTGDDYGIADAQRDKLDVICRKLDLRPGMRFLDVGCGWGGLAIYAAQCHGVHATGVTLSAQQHAFAMARIHQLGLADRVNMALGDYRQLGGEQYDSVSSIEMGEHVGRRNYPAYAAALRRMLKPGGRLLLQQMSRGAGPTGDRAPGGGAFIEHYIAPDIYMRPLGETTSILERAGLEVVDVESLREHYSWTIRQWLERLDGDIAAATRLIGEERVRTWRLYLAGGALAFEQNRMGVHQLLAVRTNVDGRAGMPNDRTDLLGPHIGASR